MSFKYLGVWFDSKCTWGAHIRYLSKKCQQRINFLRTITGTWWGAHPQDLIMLYRTTILSVMEYGSFCFQSAAKTHLIKLERIQYLCLRIALGCMPSTHTMSLEVLAGLLPLKDRFNLLSLRFFIRCKVMNPLVIGNFEQLIELNFHSGFMSSYHEFISMQVDPSSYIPNRVCFPDYINSSVHFDLSMKQDIHGYSDYQRSRIAPTIFDEKYGGINCDNMYFTDGSTINESTGFGVFKEFFSTSHSLQNPCSVYIAELAAIHWALDSVASRPVEHYYIVTDSLSSVEAIRSVRPEKHSPYFLERIREILSALSRRCYVITFIWVPSHCSIPGNERADSLAKVGAIEGDIYQRQIAFNEFYSLVRKNTIANWQRKWNEDELGRWFHSIIPKVSLKPWFKSLDLSRDFIRTFSRLMSNHCSLDALLFRFNLASSNLCVCGQGYHDIEHIVWSCEVYLIARSNLKNSLRARGRQPNVPVRDVLARLDLDYMSHIYVFLKSIDLRV
ncbi:uncharacterized protein LOC129771858 [Toxorhynchites rutilus septentrionalis]|uniref:uncharacterized protein LOC129771858 n=1 Tax=Toxorhynchites rutilus septentrionalis TaxID=329112 RepID=UPI0024795EA6|nr:uncharacterized protein LOC129771858 [Toxorhynchites rutilus septentrionalis]XP_055631942.1 uncharacterized protein LOC129771858 [Toxorhynchites rutilus septentrionalis]XP_055631952.1 uncharacterized protein LOC129771858 [Toxorhynchites rutilus septentrionalis]